MNEVDTKKTIRERTDALEKSLASREQIDGKTSMVLAGGVLTRTIYLPKGAEIVGTIHKKANINVVIGDISFTTDEGVKRITGHHIFASPPGLKRAGIAHEYTVWTTISHTNLTDIREIEEELIENPEDLQTRRIGIANPKLERLEA